jgi:hypothetical protein
VHLNGRVYDPLVGRMMSADPIVPDPLDGQAWNAYSYVVNNPLAFTDPSGYCFLGLCGVGQAISHFFGNVGSFIANRIGGIASAIVASVACTVSGPAYVICVGAVTGIISGVIAGVTTGRLDVALRSGLIAGVTAALTAGVAQGLGGAGADVAGEPDTALSYASADQGPLRITVHPLWYEGNLPGPGVGSGIGGLEAAASSTSWGSLLGGGVGSAIGIGLGATDTAYLPTRFRPCLLSSMLPGDCGGAGGGGGGGRGSLDAGKAVGGLIDGLVRGLKSIARGGRLGSARTRAHVEAVAEEMESRGWEITGGGGKLPEEYLRGPYGRLGSSHPDITATKNGRTLRVNTVDTYADGVTPTARETANAARIRAQTPGDHLLLVPKP